MLQHFEQTKISKNGTHFLARCLLCGDSKRNPYKKRFNLDWNNGVPGYHCWNCGKHGNFIEIYSIVKGIAYDDAKKELFQTWKDTKTVKDDYNRKKRPVDNPKIRKEIDEENFNWIIDRSFSQKTSGTDRYIKALKSFYHIRKIPKKYKLYICYDGRYRNRIIIPIFNENKDIIYFQARRIPGTMIEPKYDNPATPKELCILNRHLFDREKDIIIHEGLIDAFMVGNQATSCLGKEISKDLLVELLKLTNKNVIVALDNDSEAYKALAKFMKKNKYARKVKYFLYPAEFKGNDDINSIVRANAELNVYDLITQNSVSYSTAYTILKLFGG
jgi:DNA primase